MKKLLKFFAVVVLMALSAYQASAQIKDGETTVTVGETTTVSIGLAYQSTLNRATGISYNWSASNSSISIQSRTSKNCTIKGNTPGTAKLNYHCSYYIDGFYRTMDFYYDITIKSNIIYVTRISMSPESAALEIGETLQLSATAYPTNASDRSLRWSTEDYSVASVSTSGLVTARGAGRVWIWARAIDGSGAGNYCVIDVKQPTKVTSIELSETERAITIGESFQLAATVLPENAYNKSLSWSSSNNDVATVNRGTITAVGPGECDITCESTDGSSVSATCHIIVAEPEQYWLSVIVPNGNFAINVTDMESVKLRITPDEGYTINSITLDGEVQEHDNGDLVLPKLNHNSTLNVVFSSDTHTEVESLGGDTETVKVTVSDHTVAVTGFPTGERIYVYDTGGTLLKMTSDDTFELAHTGIYILRIGQMSYKLAIQ